MITAPRHLREGTNERTGNHINYLSGNVSTWLFNLISDWINIGRFAQIMYSALHDKSTGHSNHYDYYENY